MRMILDWSSRCLLRRHLLHRWGIRCEFPIRALKELGGLIRQLDIPFTGADGEDAQRFPCAEPAFCDFFEMLESVDDVADCVFFGEVEEMDGACCVGDVDGEVDDLSEPVRSLVYAEEFRYGGGGMGAEFAGGDVGW